MLPYRKDFLKKMEYSEEDPIVGFKKIGEMIPPVFEQLRIIYSERNVGKI